MYIIHELLLTSNLLYNFTVFTGLVIYPSVYLFDYPSTKFLSSDFQIKFSIIDSRILGFTEAKYESNR